MRGINTCARYLSTAAVLGVGLGVGMPVFASYPDMDIRGRLMVDYHMINEDETEFVDGFNVRRARIGVNGALAEGWDGRVEVDFAGASVSPNDFRLRYRLPTGGRLWIGQYKVPQGFQELNSSVSISLMERPAVTNNIADGRRLGLAYAHDADTFGFKTMFFGSSIGGAPDDGDQPIGLAGRAYFAPHIGANGRLHLGASVVREDHDVARSVSLGDRPEMRDGSGGTRFPVDVDGDEDRIRVGDVEDSLKLGVEAVYAAGPFSVVAEYLRATYNNEAGVDPTFDGFYVEGTYVLTGESRPYSPGGFGRISPSSPSGAWELAARYSFMDLNDSGFNGGERTNLVLGVNYYVSSRLRMMANVVFADVSNRDGIDDDSPTLVGGRAQWSF